jgi:hypothetical protein
MMHKTNKPERVSVLTVIGAAVLACLCGAGPAFAAVSAEEAATLRNSRMPLGGERAGNKEGTIPAWEGGYKTVPPGYRSGRPRPDPFAGEKPVLSITAANAGQYAERLSAGVLELLKRNPQTFRIDVYPTHRTASAPQWVYDNTERNARTAKATKNGLGFEGASGGIPFPIPKDGFEAMWNLEFPWRGTTYYFPAKTYAVTTSGAAILVGHVRNWEQSAYYLNKGDSFTGFAEQFRSRTIEPPQKSGEELVGLRNSTEGAEQQSWQYLPGQRRVRKAPSVGYDTPNFFLSGIGQFDEYRGFGGPLNRYDWKLVGKKELYVPYNNNRYYLQKDSAVIGPRHLNPDFVRWELHRVWVVDATLASGKRNVVAKRRLYLDEDTWHPVNIDEYDAQGGYWRFSMDLPMIAAELPGVIAPGQVLYDFKLNEYAPYFQTNETDQQNQFIDPLPDSFFTPDSVAAEAVR